MTGMVMLALALGVCGLARGETPRAEAAETGGEDRWVEAGHEALSSRLDPPWYDSTKDELRPINLPKPPPPAKKSADLPLTEAAEWLTAALKGLVYSVLALGLLALAWLLARAFLNREKAAAETPLQTPSLATADRIEALPFSLGAPAGDLLAAARLRYEQGDYSQAIVFLYSHELVELDRRHRIRLARGKTNRQYLRELAGQSALRSLLESTIERFERAFFGGERLDRAEFESCWQRLPQLDQLLAEAPQ